MSPDVPSPRSSSLGSAKVPVLLALLGGGAWILAASLLQPAATADGPGRGWAPLPIEDDPLLRMPGTQPDDGVELESPARCLACHSQYDPEVEPGELWRGSMMAHSAHDFIFWAALTVAAQDSIWFLDRPNATDMCLRCHMPAGWLAGRSAELNGSAMTGHDFDGVSCDLCHRMYDPFHEQTVNGERPGEGDDWVGYFDESDPIGRFEGDAIAGAAWATYDADAAEAAITSKFNGNPFYDIFDGLPEPGAYVENGSGQYFVSRFRQKRASFADARPLHKALYSRYHKSKYFCGTCHDVSNPVLANLEQEGTPPGDGTTRLSTEDLPASAYAHVERTWSEFMVSDYGQPGGAPGIGPYDPSVFTTSRPGNSIATCQDCHMADGVGKGCRFDAPIRPDESTLHPKSGAPRHDLTGGNVWVPWVLASSVPGSPNYDPMNDLVLNAGPEFITLDLTQGLGLDPTTLLAGVDRARQTLQNAAAIEEPSYDAGTGELRFRVQNRTGHKLITGYPEGRRMFVNVRAFQGETLLHEVNPYDDTVSTLKGLPEEYSPNSPPLGPNEEYLDALVYEAHMGSTITGEEVTLHFILGTHRHKDNRIPPKGYRVDQAAKRMAEPVLDSKSAPDYFTPEEYAGGYDEVTISLPADADRVEIRLFYQVISREYAEFLRDEIKGEGNLTLPPEAYVAQTDPFFDRLREWGRGMWKLWNHNRAVEGAAPVLMTSATVLP